jgi:hypothetical protein
MLLVLLSVFRFCAQKAQKRNTDEMTPMEQVIAEALNR